MFGRLFLLFLMVPLVEVLLLMKLSTILGFWETVAIQIGTAFIGATLARLEGIRVISKVQNELAQGLMPSEDMVDGLMILVGGLVLLTPGLISDFFGLLILLPFTRGIFKKWLNRKFSMASTHPSSEITTFVLR